ncbi:TPA: hypothetical protein ACGG3U_002370 [Legionella pneumophila]|nr:hypothetical protein [Legionella pneumophila]MDR9844427.1 hypothetical protein [Legionella pneumophila]MDW8987118.1 hypothetical protein [Legionella pneumophila]MDW8988841.1 hypothetical protein [Legionella pneumophila]MDW8992030.1 hypothetical protein [Legionella pneumophila]MDW8998999.1 hypothetical protein [Legionella pneumophila]
MDSMLQPIMSTKSTNQDAAPSDPEFLANNGISLDRHHAPQS